MTAEEKLHLIEVGQRPVPSTHPGVALMEASIATSAIELARARGADADLIGRLRAFRKAARKAVNW